MATEQRVGGFGTVSRLKGALFEAVSFGASVIGILALAVLLVYVSVDAFSLSEADPVWLLTYFLTLVVPYVGFCLYSVGERTFTLRVLQALGGGLLVVATVFTAFELLVRPVPRLNWQLAYLFVVAVPVTAYVTVVGSRSRVGTVGFGLIGRMLGGIALGCWLFALFAVFDPQLWFLLYTLSLLPTVGLLAADRLEFATPVENAGPLVAGPVGVAGVAAAFLLRDVITVYPTTVILYTWSIVVPLSLVAATLAARRSDWRTGTGIGALVFGVSVVAGFGAPQIGLTEEITLLVVLAVAVPTISFVHRNLRNREGVVGLALPVLLVAGVVVGTLAVEAIGVSAPKSWVNVSFLTNPPSIRNPSESGLYPAIIGSIIVISFVAVLSLILGVGTAVFLEEYTAESGLTGTITRIVQINIANLAAVPSVVYGLLGLGLFANLLGFGFGTVVTAGLTLSLLILPITVISAQEAIRSVPDDLRQGSYAMGATRWQTTKNVVLPEAVPGILTGVILALGRAIGETAPLIMIGAATTVYNPPNGVWSKISAMPMQIFEWSSSAQQVFRTTILAAGVVTLLLVLIAMNATAILIRNRYERGA